MQKEENITSLLDSIHNGVVNSSGNNSTVFQNSEGKENDLLSAINRRVPHDYEQNKQREDEINRKRTLLSERLAQHRKEVIARQQKQVVLRRADIINSLRNGMSLSELLKIQRIKNDKANNNEREHPDLVRQRVNTRSFLRGRVRSYQHERH